MRAPAHTLALTALMLALAAGCDSRWPQDRSLVCGDGVTDGEEKCDGADVGGKTCSSLGFALHGTLGCKPDCMGYDTSGCFRCGDGKKDTGEVCDGPKLGDKTCKTEGFSGGKLRCRITCQSFDTSDCYKCGDGRIDDGELCDGVAHAGQTCAAKGFEGGTLACASTCKNFDTSGCYKCGDGKITGTDVCDGAKLNKACKDFGFEGGALKCRKDCKWYDFAACFKCGDNKITGKDTCDGTDLGGKSCTSLGFHAGTLACLGDCSKLDPSSCLHHVTQYAVTPGTQGKLGDQVDDVVVDDSGNAYIVGQWRGQITAGGATHKTGSDPAGYVARLDAKGKVSWFRPIHGGATAKGSVQHLRLALAGAGDLRVSGTFKGTIATASQPLKSKTFGKDAFVLGLDRVTGKVAWGAHGTGPTNGYGVYAYGVTADHSGNAFLVGTYYSGAATFGTTSVSQVGKSAELFLAKLDSKGAFVWATSAGGPGIEEAHDVGLDGQGNIYITGAASDGATFGASTINAKSATVGHLFVAKANGSGKFLWGVGGFNSGKYSAFSKGFRVAVDAAGTAHATGRQTGWVTYGSTQVKSQGSYDAVMVAVDTTGKITWATSFGGAGHDEGQGIHLSKAGHLFVTGHFTGSAAGGGLTVYSAGVADVLLLRLSSAGKILWATQSGGAGNDAALGIAGAPGGLLYLGGRFQATASFGSKKLTSVGDSDGFLIKLKGNP